MRSSLIPSNNLRKNAWGIVKKKVPVIQKEEENDAGPPSNPYIEQQILKKKKKRLPGESLVKKFANFNPEPNISKMEETYQEGDQEGGCCQDGDGLMLAGAGVRLAGAGLVQAGSGLINLHNKLSHTLVSLASSLVNSFFRGFKGRPRSQIMKAKYVLTRQLINAFMEIPIPEAKSHIKEYAENIAYAVVSAMDLEDKKAEDQVHRKVHQGLKRVFGKVMKGGSYDEQDGSGFFKSIRGLANRAAKGLQPMAKRLFDQCASDPQSCINKARATVDRTRSAISAAQTGDLSGVASLIEDGKTMVTDLKGSGLISTVKKLPGRTYRGAKKLASKCVANPLECAETIAAGALLL